MDKLIAPLGIKTGIFRCLKAGVNPGFPEQGTPQGGVVSPLLANIALNGIEGLLRYHQDSKNRITNKTAKEKIIEPSIRYADDMVIIEPIWDLFNQSPIFEATVEQNKD
jgi:hypothetical protein